MFTIENSQKGVCHIIDDDIWVSHKDSNKSNDEIKTEIINSVYNKEETNEKFALTNHKHSYKDITDLEEFPAHQHTYGELVGDPIFETIQVNAID